MEPVVPVESLANDIWSGWLAVSGWTECSAVEGALPCISPPSREKICERVLACFRDSFLEYLFRSCIPLWKWCISDPKLDIQESTSENLETSSAISISTSVGWLELELEMELVWLTILGWRLGRKSWVGAGRWRGCWLKGGHRIRVLIEGRDFFKVCHLTYVVWYESVSGVSTLGTVTYQIEFIVIGQETINFSLISRVCLMSNRVPFRVEVPELGIFRE